MRIHKVKYGPFHEHSSQLYSIATGVPNWAKVNSGLFKMYEVSECYIAGRFANGELGRGSGKEGCNTAYPDWRVT